MVTTTGGARPPRGWAGRLARMARYAGVGSLGTVIDLGLFFGLVQFAHVAPAWSNLLSTGVSMAVSFVLNHRFVFASSKSLRTTAVRFFAVTVFSGWVVQSAAITATLHVLGHSALSADHPGWLTLLAKAVGIAAAFGFNFVSYRSIFGPDRRGAVGAPHDGGTLDG